MSDITTKDIAIPAADGSTKVLPESTPNESAARLEHLSLDEDSTTPAQLDAPPAVPEKDERYTSPSIVTAKQETLDTSAKNNETNHEWNEKEGYASNENVSDNDAENAGSVEKLQAQEEPAEDSKSEIQSIMHQFEGDEGSLIDLGPKSPTGANLPVFEYPRRTSSLKHQPSADLEGLEHRRNSVVSTKAESIAVPASQEPERAATSSTPSAVSQPPPPEPDPEPTLAFDFHRFLEQLRHRTADPVAKFLRSFLLEFGKKQWMVHEQVKIIGDFLTFISNRMGQCEVWRSVSDAEFDNAREGMEKLVMNRLYTQLFSPEIVPAEPLLTSKFRRKPSSAPLGPGRKGQHQEDVERDEVLAQKVRIYGWVREEHLDMKPFGEKGRKFLRLAQQGMIEDISSFLCPTNQLIKS